MQRCDACGVNITGERRVCPLCGKRLDSAVETETYGVFPKIPVHVTYGLIFKISTFAAILGIVVIHILNSLFLPHLRLYVPLTLGILCAWVIINVGFKKRKNIMKSILYEGIISVLLCLLWDRLTGWHGWSYGYVLPVTAASLVIFYFVMSFADRQTMTAYAGYFMISEIGIAACAVLYFCHVSEGLPEYFEAIAVGIGLVLLVAQVLFRGRPFASELHRWVHL